MRIRVLGGVEVTAADGEPVRLGELQRLLLASLAARAGTVVGVDQLIDLVWGERPPAGPEASVHSQISRLRRALTVADAQPGDVPTAEPQVEILTRPPGYVLAVRAGRLDSERFDELVAAARFASPADAADLLGEALSLWRGRAYGEFADSDVARFEAIRLEEARLGAFEARTEALLAAGRDLDALPGLEAFVAEHPLREASRMALMRALSAAGRHADALAGYRRYRAMLSDELGLEPSLEIQQLEMQILRREIPGPRPSGSALAAPASPPDVARVAAGSALPRPLTTFIGRAAERSALAALLGSNRLVTAVGPGGVGKTRLALAVGEEVAGAFADGAYFVDLVPVTDPVMIAPAVAAAFGLRAPQEKTTEETVIAWLADRRCLLILDNCEHLPEGVVALLGRLLAACPGLVVLATSRARLQVPFEWVFAVPGLSVTTTIGHPGQRRRRRCCALQGPGCGSGRMGERRRS